MNNGNITVLMIDIDVSTLLEILLVPGSCVIETWVYLFQPFLRFYDYRIETIARLLAYVSTLLEILRLHALVPQAVPAAGFNPS